MIPVAVYLEGRWILVYYLARRVVTPLSVSKAKECGAEQLAVDRCHTGVHLSCQLFQLPTMQRLLQDALFEIHYYIQASNLLDHGTPTMASYVQTCVCVLPKKRVCCCVQSMLWEGYTLGEDLFSSVQSISWGGAGEAYHDSSHRYTHTMTVKLLVVLTQVLRVTLDSHSGFHTFTDSLLCMDEVQLV